MLPLTDNSISMNTKAITIVILVIVLIGLFLFVSKTKKDTTKENLETETASVQSNTQGVKDGGYTVLSSESTVQWKGSKTLIANYEDTGTLAIKEGEFNVSNGVVSSGKVVFDMSSIKALTTGGGSGQDRLSGHLKSADFFDVSKFGEATLVINEAKSIDQVTYTLKGTLTIKDKTNPVEFPVKVGTRSDGALSAEGSVSLDRTLWDVRYGSDKFFDNLANNVIDDMFTVSFNLIAR